MTDLFWCICWCELINCTKMHGKYNVKLSQLILLREMIAVCSEAHTKHVDTSTLYTLSFEHFCTVNI
jgi:hypothetical protein